MKKIKIITVVLALAIMLAGCCFEVFGASAQLIASTPGQQIDVWLIAGQSNAVGYGENYPTDDAYASDKALLDAGVSNVWYYGKDEGNANNPSSFVPVTLGLGQTSERSGAEIGLATALNGNGRMNAVIKLAYGSSFLYPHDTADITQKRGTWTPPTYIEKNGVNTVGNRVGDLYYSFLETVDAGLSMLTESGYTPVIKGLLFMQGEAESYNQNRAVAYEELLTTFISDIRSDIGEISGQSLADIPFVYTRITYNKNTQHGAPEVLARLQASQDAVASNTALKNVFMINTETDLIDPASGEVALPSHNAYGGEGGAVEYDLWHYDALTQQMIGEAAYAKFASVNGIPTKYGIIPQDDATTKDYPFAIFTKTESGYAFHSLSNAWKSALSAAVAATANATDGDVVIYLKNNYKSTSNNDYYTGQHSKGTITVDLGGHTLDIPGALRTSYNSSTSTEVNIVVKDGTLLNCKYGFIYSQLKSNFTANSKLNVTFEGVNIGLSKDSTGANACGNLFINAGENSTTDSSANVSHTFILRNCTVDLYTNAYVKSNVISSLVGTSSKDSAKTNDDTTLILEGCTVKAERLAQLIFNRTNEGDSVYFAKGADGSWGSLSLLNAPDSTAILSGKCDSSTLNLSLRAGETGEDNFVSYSLGASDAVTVPAYGTIGSDFANEVAFPFAVFTSTAEGYEFNSAFKTWMDAMKKARDLTKNASNAKDEVIVMLRRDYTSTDTADYTSYMSNTRTKITVDLNGYTLTVPTLMNTRNNGTTTANGTIVIKNGTVLNSMYGLIYEQVDSGYTGGTTLKIDFENVYVGFAKSAPADRTGLIINSRQRTSDTANAVFDISFKNCVIDLKTNTTENANLGESSQAKYAGLDDVKITIEGGKLIAYAPSQLALALSDEGDEILISSANMPEVLFPLSIAELDGSYKFDCSDDKDFDLALIETFRHDGLNRIYSFNKVASYDYSFAVIGDTQYLTKWDAVEDTDYLSKIYDWLIRNKDIKNIKYVMGLGDITDSYNKTGTFNTEKEWQIAYEQIKRLNGVIPHSVVRGNHDNPTYFDEKFANDAEYISQFDELYEAGSALNAYSSLTVGSQKYLIFALDDNPTDAVLEWAGRIISENLDHKVIITTHTYLEYTGNLLEGENFATADVEEGENNGKQIWDKLISKHENIVLVLCGHDHRAYNILWNERYGDAGNAVTELLICPQSRDYDEAQTTRKSGMIAMLYFSNDGKDVRIEYISAVETEADFYKQDVLPDADRGHNSGGFKIAGTPVASKYGLIPEYYASAEKYPLSVFMNGNHIGSFALWNEALSKANEKISGKTADEVTVQILLRSDLTATKFDNTSQMGGTLIIDLNENTLSTGSSDLLSGTGKWYKESGSSGLMCDTTIVFENGSISVGKYGVTTFAIWADRYPENKTMSYTFNNVSFGYQKDAASKAQYLIAKSNTSTADDNTDTMYVNMTFNGCSFDLVTNAPANAMLFNFNDANSTVDASVTINGGKIIRSSHSGAASLYTLGDADSVKYARYDGSYTALYLPEGIAPAKEYLTSATEGVGEVLFVSKTGASENVYVLVPKAIAEPDFTPKTSVTLYSDLAFNIYVPKSSVLKAVTVNGNAVELNNEKGDFYVISYSLASFEAAREFTLTVTLELDGSQACGSFTLSTVKYADSIINSADDDITAEEKALAKDMLTYIRSAYVYFANAENKDAVISEIDSVLGEYTQGEFKMVEADYTVGNGLKAVTFILTSTPTIRFYLAGDSSDYTFSENVTASGTGRLSDGNIYDYVDISVYAYRMINVITYETADGLKGSYHINDYVNYVNSEDCPESEKTLTDLVEKFYNYCKAAAAYRTTVINPEA